MCTSHIQHSAVTQIPFLDLSVGPFEGVATATPELQNVLERSCVPSHGYLESSGKDWNCERGFAKLDRICEAMKIPANARLTASGNAWTRNSGFRRRGQNCEADSKS